MVLAKLIVFVSLYYAASAASVSTKQGYLIMDTMVKASCHDPPNNTLCPSFSHKVVGVDKKLVLAKMSLQGVKLQLAAAAFFNDTQACQDDLREYACSNSLMQCTKSKLTPYGFMLTYDFNRTEKACANVKQSCSPEVQAATIHNCSLIQRDPFEFAICNKHTFVPGDICPTTDYLYPAAITKFYPIHAKSFKTDFAKYGAGIKNGTCQQEIPGVYCRIMRGAICSTDMSKRMYDISAQDCFAVMNRCIQIPAFQAYFQEVCKLFPDGTTTTTIPLPTTSNVNNAANSGK